MKKRMELDLSQFEGGEGIFPLNSFFGKTQYKQLESTKNQTLEEILKVCGLSQVEKVEPREGQVFDLAELVSDGVLAVLTTTSGSTWNLTMTSKLQEEGYDRIYVEEGIFVQRGGSIFSSRKPGDMYFFHEGSSEDCDQFPLGEVA